VPLTEGVHLERGRKRRVPPRKKTFFAAVDLPSVKTVADKYIHVAYHNMHWSRAFYFYQHR